MAFALPCHWSAARWDVLSRDDRSVRRRWDVLSHLVLWSMYFFVAKDHIFLDTDRAIWYTGFLVLFLRVFVSQVPLQYFVMQVKFSHQHFEFGDLAFIVLNDCGRGICRKD